MVTRSLILTAAWLTSAALAGSQPAVRTGISHVCLAVADLDKASADFAALGFALKEGRPHPDGIRNRHVKFKDGTEIELITAPAATDDLTRHYRDFLQHGDGVAFLSLVVEPPDVAVDRLATVGLPATRGEVYVDFPYEGPLGYLFFAPLNHSPTDRPEHFAHANSATSLTGVRLESASFDAERRLVRGLGLAEGVCGPNTQVAGLTCVVLSDGGELMLAPNAGTSRARVTQLLVNVVSVDRLTAALRAANVAFQRVGTNPGAMAVDGAVTHGVTLRFQEGRPHQ